LEAAGILNGGRSQIWALSLFSGVLSNIPRTKIVLLQSKRLYPREADFVEAHGLASYFDLKNSGDG
jgi:hypothetical protein